LFRFENLAWRGKKEFAFWALPSSGRELERLRIAWRDLLRPWTNPDDTDKSMAGVLYK
jgi:hypothetical protein